MILTYILRKYFVIFIGLRLYNKQNRFIMNIFERFSPGKFYYMTGLVSQFPQGMAFRVDGPWDKPWAFLYDLRNSLPTPKSPPPLIPQLR